MGGKARKADGSKNRQRVIDVLLKMSMEGEFYSFMSYADPESWKDMLIKAGTSEKLAHELCFHMQTMVAVWDRAGKVFDQIRAEYNISEEEIEA